MTLTVDLPWILMVIYSYIYMNKHVQLIFFCMNHFYLWSNFLGIFVCVFDNFVCSTYVLLSIVYKHVPIRFVPSSKNYLRHRTLGTSIIIQHYLYKIFTYTHYYILSKLITGGATLQQWWYWHGVDAWT